MSNEMRRRILIRLLESTSIEVERDIFEGLVFVGRQLPDGRILSIFIPYKASAETTFECAKIFIEGMKKQLLG